MNLGAVAPQESGRAPAEGAAGRVGEASNGHPGVFNQSPDWLLQLHGQLRGFLAEHGFILLGIGLITYALWPRISQALRGTSTCSAAPGLTAGDGPPSAAAQGDLYASQRLAAIERQQQLLEKESRRALEENAAKEEAARQVRLQQLNEEAKRLGMPHVATSGRRLGSTSDSGDQAPRPRPQAPAPRPATTAAPPSSRRAYNPLSGGGGVGGFRSTRNQGRG